jgi:pilus assembly protein TadC
MSDVDPLATIDLSGGPDDTPVAKVGRVIGGLVLLIIGGVIALASAVAWIGGAFIPVISDWYDLIGDGFMFVGIIGLAIAVTGFELMRRTRKQQRAADAAEAVGVMTKLKTAGVYDGTSTPDSIAAAMAQAGEGFDEVLGGDGSNITPTKPPIDGPTLI